MKTVSRPPMKAVPSEWESNIFFRTAVANLQRVYNQLKRVSKKAPRAEELHILDFGGGADNSKDILVSQAEADFRAAADAGGVSLDVLLSGYEPWLLRAAWALGMGDKGSRLNLEFQPQSDADKSRFTQLNIDFALALQAGSLEDTLRRHGALPAHGFHIISCHNVFRSDPLDSSPTLLKTTTGSTTPEQETALVALNATKTAMFRLLDLRRSASPIKNKCNVLAFDPYLGDEFARFMRTPLHRPPSRPPAPSVVLGSPCAA